MRLFAVGVERADFIGKPVNSSMFKSSFLNFPILVSYVARINHHGIFRPSFRSTRPAQVAVFALRHVIFALEGHDLRAHGRRILKRAFVAEAGLDARGFLTSRTFHLVDKAIKSLFAFAASVVLKPSLPKITRPITSRARAASIIAFSRGSSWVSSCGVKE